MNTRSLTFFTLDAIKGNYLKWHLNAVKEKIESQTTAEDREDLTKLLKHSTGSTVFYRKYNSRSIDDFPVINKNTVRKAPETFLSSQFSKRKLHRMVTSGSTGTPFETFQDANKRLRSTADTIYFANLAGYDLGQPLYYLKIWSELNKKSKLTQWVQNIHPVDVLHLDNKKIESLLKELKNKKSTKHILGYSSALEKVAKFLEEKNISMHECKVGSIISMSEALDDVTKDTLHERLGVVPCSRYSNIENGIIAQQTPTSGSTFLVNIASYYVEIFGLNENRHAKPGELGRIVVTDLYNYGMPLIRYDTGDLGVISVDKSGGIDRTKLTRVEGRKLDTLLDTKGNIISSYIIYKNMWKYTEIDQYQLIQEGPRNYTFKINVHNGFSREVQLRNEFLSYLGADADFNIEYVNEIPLLNSGKRRKVVNNYLKSKKASQ